MQHSTHSLGASLLPQLGITRAMRLNLVRVLPSTYRGSDLNTKCGPSHTLLLKRVFFRMYLEKKLVPFLQLLVT